MPVGVLTKRREQIESIAFGLGAVYLLGLGAVLWAIWVGGDRWWWGTALLFAPRWPWLAPAILLIPLVLLGRRCRLIVAGVVVASTFLLGLRIPFAFQIGDGDSDRRLKVATMNVSGSETALKSLLSKHAVGMDAIFLQEANDAAISDHFPARWNVADAGSGLAVISPHPMSEVESLPRPYMPEWGSSAVRCLISTDRGLVRLVGVHLRTPRDGVEALMGKKLGGIREMQQAIFERSEEARAVRNWVNRWEIAPNAPLIVAGDFNTPVESWLYQRYWSDLSNAFGEVGSGLGHTKHTRWHGIRIDHVLGGGGAGILDCRIGDNLGSDHRPVVVTLNLAENSAGSP